MLGSKSIPKQAAANGVTFTLTYNKNKLIVTDNNDFTI